MKKTNTFNTCKIESLRNLLFISLLILSNVFLHAQNSQFLVTDEHGTAIELASIKCFNQSDSSYVSSIFTEKNGLASLNSLPNGIYYLIINYLAYESAILSSIELPLQKPLETIKLKRNIQNLQGVTISSKLKGIERKTDRIVLNVDALLSHAGPSAWELIEKSPGIITDQSSNIRMKGKNGVMVYINDKPSYLQGADLENYLKSIPAASVHQIELISTPPAKYEAAGNAGIINIVLKKNRNLGITGNASTVLVQGVYFRSNTSAGLNYLTKKIGIFATASQGTLQSFQDLYINRYYKNNDQSPNGSFNQNSYIKKTINTSNIRLSADYYHNQKTTLGIAGVLSYIPKSEKTNNLATLSDPNKIIQQKIIADNLSKNNYNAPSWNINIRHTLDSLDSKINVDFDNLEYKSHAFQNYKNYLLNNQDQSIGKDTLLGELPSDINIKTCNVDLIKILPWIKLESGIKTAYSVTDNTADYRDLISGVKTINTDLSNRFIYKEWINSAYLSASKKIFTIETQIGLRAEHTRLKGDQKGNIIKPPINFSKKYLEFFPTIYLSRNIDSIGNHNLNLSYSKRIDRPIYDFLNPFVRPLDKYTLYVGNPNLVPSFSHNISLTHSYKNIWNTSISFSKDIDGITETLEIINQVYYSRPFNIQTSISYSLSMDGNITINKWYKLIPYIELTHARYKSKLYAVPLDTKGNYFVINVGNQFQLSKTWSAELKGDYHTDALYSQLLLKKYGTVNVAFAKKFLKGMATWKIGVNDIFYTRYASGIIYNLKNTNADWNSSLDTRNITTSISYRFGKSKIQKQQYKSTGADSEKNRVRN